MRKHHRAIEMIIDPSCNQLSASRFLLMWLVMVDFHGLVLLDILGYKLTIWHYFVIILGGVAGVYGVNSGARAWGRISGRGGQEDDMLTLPPTQLRPPHKEGKPCGSDSST